MQVTKEWAAGEVARLKRIKQQREADLNGAVGALEQAYVTLARLSEPEPEAPTPAGDQPKPAGEPTS